MPVISGTPSAASSTTVSPTSWWLKCPENSALNTSIRAAGSGWSPRRAKPVAVYSPTGRSRKIVLRGPTLGEEGTLAVRTHSEAEFAAIEALVTAGKTLLLQNTLGQQWYVELAGDVEHAQIRAAPRASETYPTRHLHSWSIPLVEVDVP